MKRCVFCGAAAGNAEHVFPDWLSKEFGYRDSTVVMEREGGATHTWQSKIFQHKVKSVCQGCNNGWMSEIENKVKPYLGAMAKGTKIPTELDSEKQRDLALWAQKTFLVVQSMYPDATRNATQRMFRELFERKNIMLLSATLIGFNQSHSEPSNRAVGVHTVQIDKIHCPKEEEKYFLEQIAEDRRLICGGMKLGHVNFFIIASDIENSAMEFNIEGGMQKAQLIAPTPQVPVINWPTTLPSEIVGGWETIHSELTGDIFLSRL